MSNLNEQKKEYIEKIKILENEKSDIIKSKIEYTSKQLEEKVENILLSYKEKLSKEYNERFEQTINQINNYYNNKLEEITNI